MARGRGFSFVKLSTKVESTLLIRLVPEATTPRSTTVDTVSVDLTTRAPPKMESDFHAQQANWQEPLPLPMALMHRHPRIPVTASTMYAYASMRGNASPMYNPLHQALYPAASRDMFPNPVWTPPVPNGGAMEECTEELPRGAVFFWDPIDLVNTPPTPPLALADIEYIPAEGNNPLIPSVTLEEHLRQNPPSVGKNHYKGEDVYANFGYFKVDSDWVDPESENALYHAYMASSQHGQEHPDVPNLYRSQSLGPHVMTPEEKEEFYREYVDDVTDEKDGEGDPRLFRISPKTFAAWAAGAAVGDSYEESSFEATPKLPTSDSDLDIMPPKIKKQMQFDMETGSVLSGIYDAEERPSLLSCPLGVDAIRPPPNFSYSYPQAAIDIELKAFGADGRDQWPPDDSRYPSGASTPEVFTDAKAKEHIGQPGVPRSGDQIYDRARGRLSQLRELHNQGHDMNVSTFHQANTAAEHLINLNREIFFLQDRVAKCTPPQTSTNTQTPKSMNSSCTNLEPSISPSPPPPARRPRRQYRRRYLKESEEQEKIAVNKTRKVEERLNSEFHSILSDIEDLRSQKDELLDRLGVESIEAIPDLIPHRKFPKSDLRAEFRRPLV